MSRTYSGVGTDIRTRQRALLPIFARHQQLRLLRFMLVRGRRPAALGPGRAQHWFKHGGRIEVLDAPTTEAQLHHSSAVKQAG